MYRTFGFLLHDHRTVPDLTAGHDITDAQRHEIATSELTVEGEIEQRSITDPALMGQPKADGPDVFLFQGPFVRRLEALRRAGVVERIEDGRWQIPGDYLEQAAAYDTSRAKQMSVRVLSSLDLDAQVTADGATWLDRGLVARDASNVVASGFGHEVIAARQRRQELLVERGDAWPDKEGKVRYRKGLLATLEQRELDRVGQELGALRGMSYRMMADGEKMRGTLKEKVRLASGTYVLIENAQEFVLVPWKPVIENRIGQEIAGVMRGGAMDWQLGRQRGLGL